MHLPDTAKPATAADGEPASEFEQLGGRLTQLDNSPLTHRQALRVAERYALAFPLAIVVARHHFGEAPS
jgi:hypothetical protein